VVAFTYVTLLLLRISKTDAIEIKTIFQKKLTTSAKHPTGGAPGWILRTAGNANSIEVQTAYMLKVKVTIIGESMCST
jgi:hypothetical protein